MNTTVFIKESRKALNLTQAQLASLVNKSRSNIAHYETSRAIPSGDVVLKVIQLRFPKLFKHTADLNNEQVKVGVTNTIEKEIA